MKKIFLVLLVMTNIQIAHANDVNKTIPVMYEKTSIELVNKADIDKTPYWDLKFEALAEKNGKVIVKTTSSEIAQVSANEMTNVVTDVRDSICKAIKTGSFKIWMSFNAETKIYVVGTSASGGIEINVTCKN